MGVQFGQVLRRLRGDMSVRTLARRGNISPSYVTMLEKGTANPSLRTAVALDHAFEAGGELVEAFVADAPKVPYARNAALGAPIAQKEFVRTVDRAGMQAADDGEDATKRRRLFGLAANAGALGFDEIVRQGLDLATTPDRSAEDWDIARADHLHGLRTRPPAQVVQDLSVDLYVLRQQMESARQSELIELHRAAALLAAIQANALTRMSEHGSAIRWWSTAKKNADASRDLELSLLVRGEEAIHGLYGQREPETVLRLIENARRLTRRPWPRLMTAQAKALALLGRPAEATATLHELDDHMQHGVVGDRWDFFRPDQIPFAESWVAAYAGDETAADAARDKVLRIIPERSYQYRVNARLHEAISTAALGGVDEGARIAVNEIDSLPAQFRTNHIRETARMVLRAVPLAEQARPAIADLRSMLAIEAGPGDQRS